MQRFNVVLFNDFETLDVFDPIEVIGQLDKSYAIEFYSESGGIITSSHNVRVETLPLSEVAHDGIVLIPGDMGTRREVDNKGLINHLKEICSSSQFVLTVCTGSALLAKTGLIKNLRATSNKMAFHWVVEQDREVQWIRKARWVNDEKYYASSGVSAGIDITLGFVSDRHGMEIAGKISKGIEYIWNKKKDDDPFC